MLTLSHGATNSHSLARSGGLHKALILQRDINKTPGELHHSATDVERLLAELVELAGQETSGAPVLELLIGDILTRTSLASSGEQHYLSITALPPKGERPYCPPALPSREAAGETALSVEFLWHADEGRYVVARKVPLAELCDERALMDAILETADLATACFAPDRSGKPASL